MLLWPHIISDTPSVLSITQGENRAFPSPLSLSLSLSHLSQEHVDNVKPGSHTYSKLNIVIIFLLLCHLG